jgi:hypothetical protein
MRVTFRQYQRRGRGSQSCRSSRNTRRNQQQPSLNDSLATSFPPGFRGGGGKGERGNFIFFTTLAFTLIIDTLPWENSSPRTRVHYGFRHGPFIQEYSNIIHVIYSIQLTQKYRFKDKEMLREYKNNINTVLKVLITLQWLLVNKSLGLRLHLLMKQRKTSWNIFKMQTFRVLSSALSVRCYLLHWYMIYVLLAKQ